MVQKSSKLTLFLSLVAMALFVMLLASACDTFNFGGQTATAPANAGILAPLPANGETEVKALRQTTVQIQSAHPGAVSRVELWVKRLNEETGRLIRSDVPENGIVLQEWVPQEPGMHTVTLKPFDTDGNPTTELAQDIRIIDNQEVSIQAGAIVSQQSIPSQESFEPPTPTPVTNQAADAQIQVVPLATTPEVEEQAVRHYPPPPPAPGVPYGPTQEQMSPFGPPVCDAAEYKGVYVAPTNQRLMIKELDTVPARTVGGTTVHRAWRIQNVGTCTWGTNYELAFYGGRHMGSGGVAFESYFPSEPPRKNAIVNDFQLIAPEGKPNQTSILEVMLQAPVTPGIHQSYWRMRNPQGVYFGPIVGVTLDVVRECTHGTYGAAAINKFGIIGCADPTNCLVQKGKSVTLEYNVIGADNIDIVVTEPTGNSTSISSGDANGRVPLSCQEVGTPASGGQHTVTLYADNGSCTVTQEVKFSCLPSDGEAFELNVALSSGSGGVPAPGSAGHVTNSDKITAGSVGVEWKHFDPSVEQFVLKIEPLKAMAEPECLIDVTIFDYPIKCFCDDNVTLKEYSDTEAASAGIRSTTGINMTRELQNVESFGAAMVSNGFEGFCPTEPDPNATNIVRYSMYAFKDNGSEANPFESNIVDVICPSSITRIPGLPDEILDTDPVPTPLPTAPLDQIPGN